MLFCKFFTLTRKNIDILCVSFVYCDILFFIPYIFIFVILLGAEDTKIKYVNEKYSV